MKRILLFALTLLCATAAVADDMGMMSALVAPDGTAILRKTSIDLGNMMSGSGAMSTELVAVSATGSVKWHFTGGTMISDLTLSGDKVIVLNLTRNGTEVIALRLADGVQAWKAVMETFGSGVTATPTLIYVTSVKSASMLSGGVTHGRPSASGPMMSANMTLTALNPASGTLVWTVTP